MNNHFVETMKKRFLFVLPLVFLLLYLPIVLYRDVREKTISEYNRQQMVYARQAASSIEHLCNRFTGELAYLALFDDIVSCGDRCREMIHLYYEKNKGSIMAISRLDSTGRLIHTEPFRQDLIGVDLSAQKHVAEVIRRRQPVVSDVFTAVQGPQAVALHVPVMHDGVYHGSLAILIPFAAIAADYLAPFKVRQAGEAFVLSAAGALLYSTGSEETGASSRAIPSSLPLLVPDVAAMLTGEEGALTLSSPVGGKGPAEAELHHLVYSRAHLGNTSWIIAVTTPEWRVLAPMSGFRDKLVLLGILICLSAAVASACLLRTWIAEREERKRRKAEEALRISERNYRALIEGANSIVLKWDTSGVITYLNPFGLEFLGFTEEEIIGRNVMGTIVPETESTGRDLGFMIRDIMKNPLKYKNNINQNMKKSGERIWVAWTNEPIVDDQGNFIEIQSIGNDLTALKNAEEALKESERKYKMVAEATSDIIYQYQVAEKRLTFVSPHCADVLGFGAEELSAGPLGDNFFVLDEDVAEMHRQTRAAFACGATKMSRQYRVRCRDGGWKYVADNATLLRDANGRVESIIGSLKDISAQKDLEEKLRRAEMMEVVGTLAGGVAHDLNNILSGLVSYPDLLLMGLPEDSPIRKTVLTIKQSGEKAAAIVNDLLTLARRGVSVRQVVDLNGVIRDFAVSPEYAGLASRHQNVRLQLDLADDLLLIAGSPLHLQKTVMNLAVNAFEAMADGGVLRISTFNRYVDQPIQGYDEVKQGDYVVLEVADTGHGISPTDRQRIFEPFYTKKVMGRSGTGLGLAVVWGTVKDHRGYIDVRSEVDNGSVFILYFPVTREKLQEKIDTFFTLEEFRGAGETILVVDDVAEQRDLASTMLSRMGYQVEAVASGEAAVSRVHDQAVDLVVLDMIMAPGMDGLDTFRAITAIRPGQKAIIASGFSETERVREAQRLGAGAYLKKPYTLERLVKTVQEALRG